MTRKHKKDTALLVTNINTYIEGKKANSNVTFIITPNGNFYNFQGLLVNQDYYESNLMPAVELQRNVIDKGKHLDGRYIQ